MVKALSAGGTSVNSFAFSEAMGVSTEPNYDAALPLVQPGQLHQQVFVQRFVRSYRVVRGFLQSFVWLHELASMGCYRFALSFIELWFQGSWT